MARVLTGCRRQRRVRQFWGDFSSLEVIAICKFYRQFLETKKARGNFKKGIVCLLLLTEAQVGVWPSHHGHDGRPGFPISSLSVIVGQWPCTYSLRTHPLAFVVSCRPIRVLCLFPSIVSAAPVGLLCRTIRATLWPVEWTPAAVPSFLFMHPLVLTSVYRYAEPPRAVKSCRRSCQGARCIICVHVVLWDVCVCVYVCGCVGGCVCLPVCVCESECVRVCTCVRV